MMQGKLGTQFLSRGNCLIVETHTQDGVEWVDSSCDRDVKGFIGYDYGWFADDLRLVVTLAEGLACGGYDCAVGGKSLRIYLVRGQVPWILISRTEEQIELRISTAFVDLTEAVARTFLAEVYASGQSEGARFTQWLADIGKMGGKACQPFVLPYRKIDPKDVEQIRDLGRYFYTFALLHEFAHVLGGEDCGAGADATPLTREMACDERAFDWMRQGPLLPIPQVLMLLLSHHQALLDPMLAQESGLEPGKTYSEAHPAARWYARAELIVSRWVSLCLEQDAKGVESKTCPKGWRPFANHLGKLLDHPLPQVCGAAQSTSRAEIQADPEAARCLRFRQLDKERLAYVEDEATPVMALVGRYTNICDRPVRCEARVAMGTRRMDGPTEVEAWRPYKSHTYPFELKPGQLHPFGATIDWVLEGQRKPSVRYAQPPDRHMELLTCEFTGPAVPPAPSGVEPLCGALRELVASASQRFEELRGEELERSESTRTWNLKKQVPGTRSCSVTSSKRHDRIFCDIGTFANEDASRRASRELVESVSRCFPGVTALTRFKRYEGKPGSEWSTLLDDDTLPLWFEVVRQSAPAPAPDELSLYVLIKAPRP